MFQPSLSQPTPPLDEYSTSRGAAPVNQETAAAPSPPLPRSQDAALLTRCGCGDGQAMQEVAERFQRPLSFFCRAILNDPHIAEDAVQETLLKVWRTASTFDPERGGLNTWVFLIARSVCTDLLRRASAARRLAPGQLPDHAEAPGLENVIARPGPLRPFLTTEAGAAFMAAWDRLPEEHRTLLSLRAREVPYETMAELLGVPLGTVKSRMHNATQHLRRELGPRLGRHYDR